MITANERMNLPLTGSPVVEQAILDARIAGERVISIIRLFLLIPITIFAVIIFIADVLGRSLGYALASLSFYVEIAGIVITGILSLWILKEARAKRYHSWIKYVVPFLEVLLLTLVNLSIATDAARNLLITGAVVLLYYVFLILNSLRNLSSSVILTGILIIVAYGSCSIYALAEMRFFAGTAGEIFSNAAGGTLRLAWDDEIIKLVITAMMTGLLAFSARRFNAMIRQQTALRVEREDLRQTLVGRLKDVTQNILSASQKLFTTTEQFTQDIGQLIDSSQKIGTETESEFVCIEQTTSHVLALTASIDNVTANIHQQALLVQESVSAIEELNGSITVITHTAQQANILAGSLADKAGENMQWVNQVVSAVKETEQASQTISDIVEIISAMASSTELLAMNTAIEAAHAGEAGKGFAVIADEISRLAETVSRNAGEINNILNSIRQRIAGIVQLSDQAHAGLAEMLAGVDETKNINQEILNAMEEEAHGVQEILSSTQKLSLITQEVQGASISQNNQSKEIISAVEQMKLQADSVYSQTVKQKEKCTTASSSADSLHQVIHVNKEIIEKLEQLVSRL